MSIKYRILLASAVSALALAGCNATSTTSGASVGQGPAAATVNGAPISERLVAMMLKQRTDLGRDGNAEARNGFIDRLAMQLVITQEAVKKGLDKAPESADKLELSRQSILVDAFVQDYLKNNVLADEALGAEYEKFKTQAAGIEYKARHILVDQEADAKDIIAKLTKNAKVFEALAKEKSKDGGSKGRGGDLGWFDPRGMVPEFGAAVAKLEKGKFSGEPVKSQFGYHVILLEDSRQKAFPPLEQIKDELRQQVQQQNLKKYFDELKAKAKIEVVQAPAPAAAPAKDAAPAPAAAPAKAAAPAEPVKK